MQFQLRLKSFNPLWFLGLCFSDQSSLFTARSVTLLERFPRGKERAESWG